MKKLALVVALGALVTACSTSGTNDYQKRADAERERQAAKVASTIKQAPDWFMRRPKNTNDVVYGVGYGESTNMMSAMDMAENEAYRQICTGNAGTVDSQSKVFRADRDGNANSLATTAIRTRCLKTDITGVEIINTEIIQQGNRYAYYILVALPLGDANTRVKAKETQRIAGSMDVRAEKEFKELDRANRETAPSSATPTEPATPTGASVQTPAGTLTLLPVENAEYKAKRDAALQKPNAVIGQMTVPM